MRNIYFIILLIIFILSVYTDFYEFCIYGLLILLSVKLLAKFGRSITLREMIAVYSCIIYLWMPLLGYKYYTSRNFLSHLWVRYMPIPETVYFGFALPALTAFFIGLFFPSLGKTEDPDSNSNIIKYLNIIKYHLSEDRFLWKPIIILGMVGFAGNIFSPIDSLAPIFFTFYLFLFTGFLYIYYSRAFKFKNPTLVAIVVLIVMESVQSGMFTVLVYMGITLASILFVGMRISFLKKLVMVSLVLFLVITLQLSKRTYRNITWRSNYQGSKIELLSDLMTENIKNYDELFSNINFFPIYVRMNQGYNVALVMRRIPAVQSFDDGNSIMLTVGSALVPRFLWPDKLKSGGIYNMYHFAGFKLKGWSTNIGPVGEAYGNFGIGGGILFMFIFGLFIRGIYFRLLLLARKLPLLIFWIPVLFFELSYSMENDTLQALNSIIKISIFIYLLYLVYPSLFGSKTKSIT